MKQSKTVWITGASSGIGEALCYAYATSGHQVIISARRKEALKKVRANCGDYASNVFVMPLDLEKNVNAGKWYTEVKNIVGTPDILINNGGIGHLGTALEMQEEVERKVMEINFWGQVALSKAVLPDFIERGTGKLVIMSSLLGHYGTSKLAAYAASKHALLGYFESLREELIGTGVKLLLVSPGFVNTQVTLNSLTASGDKYNANSVAQEQGMKPEVFAKKLIRAISSNKNYAYIGGKELLAIPFKRVAPNLFYSVYRWLAKKVSS